MPKTTGGVVTFLKIPEGQRLYVAAQNIYYIANLLDAH